LDFVVKLGPEPLTPDGEQLTGTTATRAAADFLQRVRHHQNMVVKAAILDQTVIGGVGNIYADEALWAARVHPMSRVRDLTDPKLRPIFREAGDAKLRSLAAGGSTMSTYIQADGTPGSYLDQFANVFRREGEPCPRCGAAIEKIRVAGRGTHLCPRCQRVAVIKDKST
jgi:formamidopyrimidine-DNA glycosylase